MDRWTDGRTDGYWADLQFILCVFVVDCLFAAVYCLLDLNHFRQLLKTVLTVACYPPFCILLLVFCFSVIFACVCYTRNVINVTSIGRQISELMFLWWPAILYSVLFNYVCLLMANKWMMMMMLCYSVNYYSSWREFQCCHHSTLQLTHESTWHCFRCCVVNVGHSNELNSAGFVSFRKS